MMSTTYIKRAVTVLATGALLGLAACNGSSNSITSSVLPNSNGAQVRFANGSPAVNAAVDVAIDGTIAFHAVSLDAVTNYISVSSGTHAVSVYPAGNDAGTSLVSSASFSVNGSNYETLAIGGTSSPVYYAFSDQVFSGSYSGFGAANFYNISPATTASGAQFGFYNNPTSSGATPTITDLGTVTQPGIETAPIGLPNNVALGFAAAPGGSTTANATLLPSAIDPNNCSANTFSCNSGFVSVFLADGNKMFGMFSGSGT